MSGAVRIAPAPGRCRAARHAVFAAIGARPAGRHSAHSRARCCRACTIRSAGWPSAPRLAQARRSERLPSAAGLRRARRIAGVTASWRRCAKLSDRLAGIVEADESFVLESRIGGAEAGSQAAPARRQGPQTRPLARAGADPGCRRSRRRDPQPHLARPQYAKSVKEALEPVVARDALLVSDANRCYPPVAATLGIPHESLNGAAGKHIQINSRHSQIKGFLRGFRASPPSTSTAISFHLIELGDQPSPRACLKAASIHRAGDVVHPPVVAREFHVLTLIGQIRARRQMQGVEGPQRSRTGKGI